jgi:primary-amine oxidase
VTVRSEKQIGGRPGRQAAHPLDPLKGPEMRRAVEIARSAGKLSERARVVEVSLREPPKVEVLGFRPETAFGRAAFVVSLEPLKHITYEGVVDLREETVVSWRAVEGVRAPVTLDEYARIEALVRRDPAFRAGLRRRGITEPDQVLVEPWGIGDFADEVDEGRRLVWTLAFYRAAPDDNPYAKPVDGLHAIVDVDDMVVLRVEDQGDVTLPPENGAYTPDKLGPSRGDLRPVEIHQPDGVSFEVDGWEVRWQKWRFRIGWTSREGLVLHTVGYQDGDRDRPVVYRASVAELVIPYADPRRFHAWRNAFDIGEYGIGIMANALELGCDCLGEIRYLDVEMVDTSGTPYTVKNAICIHEEDFGILWKHYDAGLDHAEVRRSRRLVVSFIITAGNYEYAFYWYLYQDGVIELEVKLTGIVLTSALPQGETSDYGTIVAPQTLAAHHQHFFSVRLDMAVDGLGNSVYEVNTEQVPRGPDNPYGNAFRPVRTLLATEAQAQRVIDPLAGRYWLVVNPNVTNRFGQPVGYKLAPHDNVLPFAHPDASVVRRARFMTKHLWVTPFSPHERFPAGEYPNQHPGEDGLPAWTAANRSIQNTDLVLWYTLGVHHISRPEDWPVMPVERASFALKPLGFFDQNPSLDVPPAASDHCRVG